MQNVDKIDNVKGGAFSYARWSSNKQTEGDSLRRQICQAESWCLRHGLRLSKERFVDSGVSAYRGKNQSAELGRLVEQLKAGDVLLVEDADRLSRQDWKAAMDFVDRVLAKGVKIVTLQNGNEITAESFRTNPGVFLQLILNAHLGHSENVKKAARVREAWVTKRAEIRAGTAIRQRLPGWLFHEKSFVGGKTVLGAVKVDEAKAATVRQIFKLTLAGWSRRRIAKEFNSKGVPSVSGQAKHWNAQSILACIIRNPAVIGDYKSAEGEIIKGIFPAIVDERTFYAANAAVTGRRELTTPAAARARNLVTGLVRCPTCDGTMNKATRHAHGKAYSYLVCSKTKHGENQTDCTCRPGYDAFESSLLALLRDSATLRKALGQPVGEPTELTALRGKVDAAERKLNQLMALLEATPSKALAARVQALELGAEALRAELQAKEATLKGTTPPGVAYEKFVGQLAQHLQEPEYRERVKVALRDIIERIQFHDKMTFTVYFRGGQHVEVWMSERGFAWELAKQIGDKIAVP